MGALEHSLARLDSAVTWARLLTVADDQPGWVRCSDLLDSADGMTTWQRAAADSYGGGTDGGLLTGQGLVLDWYLAAIALPAAGLFHLDRRVPVLAPESMSVQVRAVDGSVLATAVESPRFSCLPGDSAAAEGEVVDDVDGLAAVLRTGIVSHAHRLVRSYAPTTRIGAHGLWAAVSDAVDVAFMTGGWVSHDMVRAAADAQHVLGRAGVGIPPLIGGSTLHRIRDERGRFHWTRRRHSCCFVYRSPGATECVTCPRVSAEQRRRMAVDWKPL